MFNLSAMPFKFFQKDVITGSIAKVGDTFTAVLMGGTSTFKVEEIHGNFVMAVLEDDK